ncbi:MAG TPA: restriction endonuclease [Thermoanaerobaculia bacterium]|nr:restriction endonuclease [Thermoanaerobaculia bacterium]
MKYLFLEEGWSVEVASTPDEVAAKLESRNIDVCMIEQRFTNLSDPNDLTGVNLLLELAPKHSQLRFIVTAQSPSIYGVATRIQAPELGARVLGYFGRSTYARDIIESIKTVQISRNADLASLLRVRSPSPALIEAVQALTPQLLDRIRKEPHALHHMDAFVFEELVAELLASFGWCVELTAKTRDGGYDIFGIRQDATGLASSWIIECKRYREDRKVGIDVVRALYAVKSEQRVGMSMLATTSSFTSDVYAYKASRYDLELADANAIIDWIDRYQPDPAGKLYSSKRGRR